MKLTQAINIFIDDMKAEGRINSARSERSYWDTLVLHAEDVGNRDPRTVNRDDVKRTLRRWPNRNTRRVRHAYLTSFYDWTVEEGYRKDNPARAVRRTKPEKVEVYKLTATEMLAMRQHAHSDLEQRLVAFGLFAGLRVQEMRGLKGRHLARDGWVHVSKDIGKGGIERWIPVMPELAAVIERLDLGLDEHVFPAQHYGIRGKARERSMRIDSTKPMGAVTMWRYVRRVAERAGIVGDVGPHTLRHAFCDLVTRGTSLDVAQTLMGHADIGTTRGYRSAPTLDELRQAIGQLTMGSGLPPSGKPGNPSDGDGGNRTHVSASEPASDRESGQEEE